MRLKLCIGTRTTPKPHSPSPNSHETEETCSRAAQGVIERFPEHQTVMHVVPEVWRPEF